MFVLVLLLSFFIQVSASDSDSDSDSDRMIISAEQFLEGFARRLKGEVFEYTQLPSIPAEDLITVHLRRFGERRSGDLSTLVRSIESGSEELVGTIKVYDPKCILMHDRTFTPALHEAGPIISFGGGIEMYRASGCTRTVVIYNCNGHRVCIKHWPEAPWNEIAVHQVYKAVFQDHEGLPLPKSEAFLMNGQVFLASEFMDGKSFDSILASVQGSKGARDYIFNLQRFQRLAVLCLITVPEDGCPRNLLVRQIKGSGEHEFVLIDNDRNFGEVVSPEIRHPTGGIISTRVHCALFCLHEMLAHPIDPSIFGEIMRPKSGIVREVILRLLGENSYQLGLQTFVNQHALAEASRRGRETTLGIPFNGRSTIGVAYRLNRFVEQVLSDRDSGTISNLADIITRVCEPLAKLYKLNELSAALISVPTSSVNLGTILERIAAIDPRGVPGAVTPASADALPAYYGSAESNPEMLLHILTWVRENCSTLDDDITEIMGIVETIVVHQSDSPAATSASPGFGRRKSRVAAAAIAVGGRCSAASAAAATSGGRGVVSAAASSGSGRVAVATGRGACARSGARIVRRGR